MVSVNWAHSALLRVQAALIVGTVMSAMTSGAAVADVVEKPRSISISASGYVEAEPDVARVTVGVVTQAESANEALAENSELFQSVLKAVRQLDIAGADIATAQFQVRPVYARNKSSRGYERNKIDGFRVTNSATVTVRDIGKTGAVIDNAAGAGANRIGSIRFEVSGRERKLDFARQAAMRNAIRRAKLFAEAAGATLGEVLSINEQVQHYRPQNVRMEARSSMAAPAPIAPGQQRLGVTVNVQWRLE